jgi:hypothetical protein
MAFLVIGTSDSILDIDIGRKLVPTSNADIEYTKY